MLVAGGGTGDDVLQMAEQMVDKEGQVELPHCVVYSSVYTVYMVYTVQLTIERLFSLLT